MDEKKYTRLESPMFFKLWDLMQANSSNLLNNENKECWRDYNIYAKTTKDITVNFWNGSHDPSVEANYKEHVYKAGTRVLIWMVSRFCDVGITDNLINPKGYDVRGLDADVDLTDYEFIKK